MKLILAPIHGMTNAVYRNSFSEIFGGFDIYYTPFVSTTDLRIKDSVIFDDLLTSNNNDNLDIVPQILGNHGEDFIFFGNRIAEFGYNEINWNLGCPQRNITKKIKGSGLLKRPDLIKATLNKVCANKTYDLSVKIRLGFTHLGEGEEVIKILNDYPIKSVTIHPRTAKQMYGGHVDLDAFDHLYKQCKHEVIYNGDINSKEDLSRIRDRFPNINKFMIGRGALRNPFLPMSIKGIEYRHSDKLQMVLDFHDRIFNNYLEILTKDIQITGKMKEFWPYLAWFFDDKGSLMKSIRLCKTVEDYNKVINNLRKQL